MIENTTCMLEQPCDYVKQTTSKGVFLEQDLFDIVLQRCVDDNVRHRLQQAQERSNATK